MNQHELLPDAAVDPALLLDADLDAAPRSAWAEILVRLIEQQEAAFRRNGHSDEAAFRLARIGTMALAEYAGGRTLYIPRGDALKTAIRDAAIFRDAFRGNIPAIAKKHGISDRHVWRILNRQQKLHVRKLQPDMFESSN